MLQGLTFVMLHVPDIEEAKAFYNGKLGFEIVDTGPGFLQFKQSETGAMFAIEQGENAAPHQGVDLWWQVANADATYAQLQERGVEVVSPPNDEPFGRALSIKDPAGNTLNLFQEPIRG